MAVFYDFRPKAYDFIDVDYRQLLVNALFN